MGGGEKACKLVSPLDGSWVGKMKVYKYTLCVKALPFPKAAAEFTVCSMVLSDWGVSLSPVVTSTYQSIPDNKPSRA